MKTFAVTLFKQVPIDYLLENDTGDWLRMCEDSCLHPKMAEIAGPEIVHYIKEVLYVYDSEGSSHDNKKEGHRGYFKKLKRSSWTDTEDLEAPAKRRESRRNTRKAKKERDAKILGAYRDLTKT